MITLTSQYTTCSFIHFSIWPSTSTTTNTTKNQTIIIIKTITANIIHSSSGVVGRKAGETPKMGRQSIAGHRHH